MSTVTATISRTLLSEPTLSITSAPYEIMGNENANNSGFDIGQTVFSRVWATSAYVGGAVQVMSVPGMVSATLKLYIYDTTALLVEEDLAVLLFAFGQATYTLTFSIDSAIYAWTCYNADYQIDPWPLEAVVGPNLFRLGITLDIPRSPYPVLGPI